MYQRLFVLFYFASINVTIEKRRHVLQVKRNLRKFQNRIVKSRVTLKKRNIL